MGKTTTFVLVLIVIILAGFIVLNMEKILDGERDDYGCLVDAGFRLNETLKECVREIDLDLEYQVIDFETCLDAGYEVLESYPRGCKTLGENLFIEEIEIGDSCDFVDCPLGYECRELELCPTCQDTEKCPCQKTYSCFETTENINNLNCEDPDGGLNYYEKSSLVVECEGPCGVWPDSCKDEKILVEYYCDEELNDNFVEYECGEGCVDGACVGSAQTDCAAGSFFVCEEITLGEEPSENETIPIVCGCKPLECGAGEQVVVSLGEGVWADGFLKGLFECSEEVPA